MTSLPFKVRAVFEYSSPHADDLNFPLGQIITVTEEEGDEWYIGDYVDSAGNKRDGLFPRNFVERYEPEAPPRPTRARPKKETVVAEPEPESEVKLQPSQPTQRRVDEPGQPSETAPVLNRTSEEAPGFQPIAREPAPVVGVAHSAASAGKAQPPPVAEKPSSFKDRIAAFNKAASSPVAPIKPGAPAGSGFVKKAFVAPPPARDAYVPVHREAAPIQKVYRREEDPEIAERQAQDQEDAAKAGLLPGGSEEGDEPAPRATTLKERIALLQQEQQAQAARRAELAAKEKPQRPPRQRTESGDTLNDSTQPEPGQLARVNTAGSQHRISLEETQETSRAPPDRRTSRDQRTGEGRPSSILSDGNDADQSAGGETTEEADGDSTEIEENEPRSRHQPLSTAPAYGAAIPRRSEQPSEHEQRHEAHEEIDEIDAETRRKLELRERMAKMSGGMGMAGMFGPPIGMPMAGASHRPKQSSGTNDAGATFEQAQAVPTQRVPVVPMPGMRTADSPERTVTEPSVEKEREAVPSIAAGRDPRQIPDVEDVELQSPRLATSATFPTSPRPDEPPSSPTRQRTLARAPTDPGKTKPFGSPRSREDRRRSLLQSRSNADFSVRRGCSSFSAYDGAPVMPLTAGIRRRPVPPQPPQAAGLPQSYVPPVQPPQSGRYEHGQRPAAAEQRAAPPPPPRGVISLGPEYESDDEQSVSQPQPPAPPQRAPSMRGPPPPIPSGTPARPDGPRSPPLSSAVRMSYIPEAATPSSPTFQQPNENRSSRFPPPIPSGIPTTSPPGEMQLPPRPPPPTAVPSMRETGNNDAAAQGDDGDTEESDYEGDYDTDIASGAPHRDAIRSRAMENSSDDGQFSEDIPSRVAPVPLAAPPPMPTSGLRGAPPMPQQAQRGMPPPPPHQQQQQRLSMEGPRQMPPAPPGRDSMPSPREEDEDYDPYRYTAPPSVQGATSTAQMWIPDRPIQESDPSFYGPPPPRPAERLPLGPPAPSGPPQAPPQDRRSGPPPAPSQQQSPMLSGPGVRQSHEYAAQPVSIGQGAMPGSPAMQRRSVEQSRPSVEQAYIARDVDVGEQTLWWTRPNLPPPVFQNRSDVLCEFEESTTSKRGGRTTVSKDVYVLFPDYSQTVVTARFDSKEAADVVLEQRHEPPAPPLRRDALQAAHQQFGSSIATAAHQRTGHSVLDGSPHALVLDILRKQTNALLPVGNRAYGVCIYANLSNATVQQCEEIRAGDIISFRNAKFQGKHGAMHAKYSEDVGKPDHVGIVAEWDGSKRKVRVFEQGRDGKKGVRIEAFRFGDLRSGEVKVWRVIGRDWVGWETQS